MKLLVTGGAGFIGSNLVRYFLEEYEDVEVINLDLLTYAGNLDNLAGLEADPRYHFVHGDICDASLVGDLVREVDAVLNLAAESHVDRSIAHDTPFVRTNVNGTHTLLSAALAAPTPPRFVQVSTNEVYGELPWREPDSAPPASDDEIFTESTPLAPRSPYSATKASGDLLALARVADRHHARFSGTVFELGEDAVIEGDAHVHHLREVRLEDLLGRDPIKLELPELSSDLEGETVLITGAAGSIGYELARQVALHTPGKLILVDQAETPLYYIDLELGRKHPDLDVEACLIDVTDCTRLDQVFALHEPSRVFHAAAYKHVPMMEVHPRAAVHNNVLGTWLVAKAAGEHGAERFILVSSDKAVRPANVMGATKRIAELVTLYLQDSYPKTAFGAVRFGNVLGSDGSVIPLFKRQLEAGEPLTVTHEDVSRFFMTIPEAVQLILQSSLLPRIKGGITMLEMGEPVPIMELAKNLLRLSGKGTRVGRDIVIVGLRPGEKLQEELTAPHEKAIQTGIEKVNLLDTSVAHLPEPIATAIEEEHIEDVMAYLWSEIMAVDLEAEVAINVGNARAVRSH